MKKEAGSSPAAQLPGFVSGVSAQQDWLQGQAAAVFGGMGFARQVLSSRIPAEDVLVLPAPSFGPRRASPSVACRGLVVPSGSQAVPEAAWALVEWLALGEPARQRFAGGLGLPAARSAVEGITLESPLMRQLSALVQQEIADTQAFGVQASTRLDADLLAWTWARQEERYLTGELGLDEMLAAVEEEVRLAALSKIEPYSRLEVRKQQK